MMCPSREFPCLNSRIFGNSVIKRYRKLASQILIFFDLRLQHKNTYDMGMLHFSLVGDFPLDILLFLWSEHNLLITKSSVTTTRQ